MGAYLIRSHMQEIEDQLQKVLKSPLWIEIRVIYAVDPATRREQKPTSRYKKRRAVILPAQRKVVPKPTLLGAEAELAAYELNGDQTDT